MQDDVQILRGSEFQPSTLHGERCRGAADQDELIRVTVEMSAKNVESLHHGKCSFNSSSASSIRSSMFPWKLRLSESGSTVFSS